MLERAAEAPHSGGLLIMFGKHIRNTLLGALLSLMAAYLIIVIFVLKNEIAAMAGRRSARRSYSSEHLFIPWFIFIGF